MAQILDDGGNPGNRWWHDAGGPVEKRRGKSRAAGWKRSVGVIRDSLSRASSMTLMRVVPAESFRRSILVPPVQPALSQGMEQSRELTEEPAGAGSRGLERPRPHWPDHRLVFRGWPWRATSPFKQRVPRRTRR